MKTPILLALACVVGAAFGAARADTETHRSVQKAATADLDGDGVDERIVLTCYTMPEGSSLDRFVLEVNAAGMVVPAENVDGTLHLVDIDEDDAFVEIAVPVSGASGVKTVRFFRYAGGQLWTIGEVAGAISHGIEIDGAGTVRTKCPGEILHTWWFPCRYEIDRITGRLDFVHDAPYEMNSKVVLKRDLTVYTLRAEREVAGVVKKDEKATILRSDNEHWCLIESESGVRGWFRVSGYAQIGGVDARDVFDGLQYAD